MNLMDVQEQMEIVTETVCATLIPENASAIHYGQEPTVVLQIVQETHLVQVMVVVTRPQFLAGVTVIETGQGRLVIFLVSTERIMAMLQGASVIRVSMASDATRCVLDRAVASLRNVCVMQVLDTKDNSVMYLDVQGGQRIAAVMAYVT